MQEKTRGQIITFYSYKGGTGRTMALANVACILAKQQSDVSGKDVLMIDWDLEAPGLHRYFRSGVGGNLLPHSGRTLLEKPGTIDLFRRLEETTEQILNDNSKKLSDETLARITFSTVEIERYIHRTEIQSLYLMNAGQIDEKKPEIYANRVNSFRWETLYRKSPALIRYLIEYLAEHYAYILIDSRTGITDISGICTMLMPEKLVIVFTPNRQSLQGGIEILLQAAEYRKESNDVRPLIVYPLVSRVEANEPELRKRWRIGDPLYRIPSYQAEFENAIKRAYNLTSVELTEYFDEIQIQHIPHYAYGEEIAAITEDIGDRFSLKRSYKDFANYLIHSRLPWASEADSIITKLSRAQNSKRFYRWVIHEFLTRPTLYVGFIITLAIFLLLVKFLIPPYMSFLEKENARRDSLFVLQRDSVNRQKQSLIDTIKEQYSILDSLRRSSMKYSVKQNNYVNRKFDTNYQYRDFLRTKIDSSNLKPFRKE
jgi:MinD-like ATPase involved in chromosome partitioning or flagellar assembly